MSNVPSRKEDQAFDGETGHIESGPENAQPNNYQATTPSLSGAASSSADVAFRSHAKAASLNPATSQPAQSPSFDFYIDTTPSWHYAGNSARNRWDHDRISYTPICMEPLGSR
ncbi:MAG: hypothetical protein Q9183_007379, partial [Haloplaca sp. 2 TL-2023]